MNKWLLVECQIKFLKLNAIIICSMSKNVDTQFRLDVVVKIKDHAINVMDLTIIVRMTYVRIRIVNYIGMLNKLVAII